MATLLWGEQTPVERLFPGQPGLVGTRKAKTILDFNEAGDDEVLGWQWHLPCANNNLLCCRQINMPTPLRSFLQVGCSSFCPSNSVRSLRAIQSNKSIALKAMFVFCFSFTLRTFCGKV